MKKHNTSSQTKWSGRGWISYIQIAAPFIELAESVAFPIAGKGSLSLRMDDDFRRVVTHGPPDCVSARTRVD